MINNSNIYNPQDIIKKEAVTMDYSDLGEFKKLVQNPEYIKIQKYH
jgi:hypothetical protein